MKFFKLALVYGFVLWVIPFAVAMALFQVRNTERPLFESIMPVVLVICATILADRYLGQVTTHFVRDGILLGLLWLMISIAFDLLLFMWGPMQMSLATYLKDIGLTYLIYPVITIGMGYLLAQRRITAVAPP
ncbi:MAG: hypothetical protein DYG89_47105 [Caldilinea sp. CFX5]|nr:hypothetical protein [Caldilinea sp. CFX5]